MKKNGNFAIMVMTLRNLFLAFILMMMPGYGAGTAKLDSIMESAYRHLDDKRPDKALSAFVEVSSYKDSIGITRWDVIANALYNAGVICSSEKFDYYDAYRYLSESLNISLEHGLKDLPPYIYLATANHYLVIDLVRGSSYFQDEIISLFKLCYEEAVELKYWNLALSAIDNASWYALVNDKDSECADLARFFDISAMPPSEWRDFSGRYVEALGVASRKGFREAAGILDTIIPTVSDFQVERMKIDILVCKARLLHRADEKEEAARLLLSAKEWVEANGCYDLALVVYREMWKVEEDLGDMSPAHEYYNRYLQVRDSLQSYCRLQDMSESQLDSKIGRMTEDLRDMSDRQRVSNVIIVMGVLVIVMLVVALTMVVIRQKRMRKSNLILFKKAMSAVSPDQPSSGQELISASEAERNDIENLYSRITEAMENTDLLCDENFKVGMLASYLGKPTKAVSTAIRECYNGTFSQLLNEFRMKEACRRLSNTADYGNYTIEAISVSLGIKSRTGFIASFKKATGLTPSQFQRIAKGEDSRKHQDGGMSE